MLTTSNFKFASPILLSFLMINSTLSNAQIRAAPLPSEELGRINYTLKGEIIRYSCAVDASSANKYINLGRWASAQITYQGHGYTNYVPFEIRLNDCPPNSAIKFQFTGIKDTINSELLAIENKPSSAKNVAIEIANANEQRIPMGKIIISTTSDANGNAIAKFKARYRATQKDPTVGSANADSTFIVTYD